VDSALKRLVDRTKSGGAWVIAGLEAVQETRGAGRSDPGYFHPSDFGNECDAYLAFKFLGAPAFQIIAARTQRIFDLGHARDEALKRDMKNAGLSIIKNPITKELYVVDYKTMRPGEFEELKEVKFWHHIQVHIYMFAKQIFKGFVLYENKGTQELKVKEANFNNELWETYVVQRIQRVMDGLAGDFVNRNPVNCSRCPFNSNGVCAGNDIAGLKAKSGLFDVRIAA
jgi:hypothetical protein